MSNNDEYYWEPSKYRYLLVRGGEMESLLFALMSIVILFPILYFLPIGFSIRGKITVLIVSLLIVLLGLMASQVVPLWQTLLLELLVVGIVTYLLNQRLGNMLFATVEDDEVFEEENHSKSVLEGLNETYSYIASSDKFVKQSVVEEQATTDEPVKENHQLNVDLDSNELFSSSELEVAVASEELEETTIEIVVDSDQEDEGYLGEIEEYLSKETTSKDEDILVIDDEQPLSMTVGDISDLELQILEAADSSEEPNRLLEDEFNDVLTYENNLIEIDELEGNSLELEKIELANNSFKFDDDLYLEKVYSELQDIEAGEKPFKSTEENTFELEELIDDIDSEAIPKGEQLLELEELEDIIPESETKDVEVSSIKLKFNLDDDDDDDDFWRMLLEDDEDEKKESTTTDKLERMWERTGLAKKP